MFGFICTKVVAETAFIGPVQGFTYCEMFDVINGLGLTDVLA